MQTTTIQLPSDLYDEIESVARAEHDDPTALLVKLLKTALQQYLWRKGWQELREMVQRDGGLQVGNTIEEIVEHMRKTREEIFEAEYAHLYR
jgi:hypothetical protein